MAKKFKREGRSIQIGDPTKVRITLIVDDSGTITNKENLVVQLDEADLSELVELHTSLLGRRPSSKKEDKIKGAIAEYLGKLETSYREIADSMGAPPTEALGVEAVSEAPTQKAPTTIAPTKKAPTKKAPTTIACLDGEASASAFVRTFKGTTYTLHVTDTGCRLECEGDLAGDYSSPHSAAVAVSGYASVNGRSFFGMGGSGRKSTEAKGKKGSERQKIKPLVYRDPRLPVIDGQRTVVRDGTTIVLTCGESSFHVTSDKADLGHFSSILDAARAVDPQATNGYDTFGINFRSEILDPALLLGALLESENIIDADVVRGLVEVLRGSFDVGTSGVKYNESVRKTLSVRVHAFMRAVNEADVMLDVEKILNDAKRG